MSDRKKEGEERERERERERDVPVHDAPSVEMVAEMV